MKKSKVVLLSLAIFIVSISVIVYFYSNSRKTLKGNDTIEDLFLGHSFVFNQKGYYQLDYTIDSGEDSSYIFVGYSRYDKYINIMGAKNKYSTAKGTEIAMIKDTGKQILQILANGEWTLKIEYLGKLKDDYKNDYSDDYPKKLKGEFSDKSVDTKQFSDDIIKIHKGGVYVFTARGDGGILFFLSPISKKHDTKFLFSKYLENIHYDSLPQFMKDTIELNSGSYLFSVTKEKTIYLKDTWELDMEYLENASQK
ncbi:MAG: hypothetical protein IPJ45_09510 [Ignavibacteria bacterium]|nr:hypothetical protein [Ignavibacteria bacterium]